MDINSILRELKNRRFIPHYFETVNETKEAVLNIIGNKSVGFGGSATVRDLGLYEALSQNGNVLHWHWKADAENKAFERNESLKADVFVSGTNALLKDGRLVNIDGTGNRLSGLIYGPSIVICVLGVNKIVENLDDAIARIKRDCCPENARRLNLKTPCALTGECADCRSESRMCNVISIHEAPTRPVKEFHVIIVNKNLGL